MALTTTDIGNAATNGSFVIKVQGALQKYINLVAVEDESTADYVVRRKFMQRVAVNLSEFALRMAVSVAAVLPGTVSDLNLVTDAQMDTAVAAVWTQTAYAYILPS